MGKLWENDNIERDSPSKIICPKLFFQACQLTVADILPAYPSYSVGVRWLQIPCKYKKDSIYNCPFVFTEREGFEPSIPVSQYTRLAGERLRPYSAISPFIILEIIIYLNYFIMSNKKYIFLKKAVKYALFLFLYRSAVQTLLLCRT